MDKDLLQHIPCSVMTFSDNTTDEKQSGNLEKVKIVVMHEGGNGNKTHLGDEAIADAEPTLKNVPILAYIKRDEDGEAIDFDQHNIITKFVPNDSGGHDVVRYYLERPIGVIPESNNYRIEEIDGVNHVVVDGYIWKSYSNEGYGLITETGEKGVSMEISVEEGSKDLKTGLYNITKYSYLGVTVLGDDMPPAMGDTCKLTTYSQQSDEYQFALKQINEEIQKMEKEATNMTVNQPVQNNPVQEPVQNQEPDTSTATEPVQTEPTATEPVNDPAPQQANFSLSVDNIREGVRKVLNGITTEKKYSWSNETYEVQNYWLRTIIPSENIAVVEDEINNYTYYGVPFSLNGDEVVLDLENKQEYIQTWRKKDTGTNNTLVFSDNGEEDKAKLVEAQFTKMNDTIAKLEGQVKEQDTELEGLRTFKLNKDQEALANEVNTVVMQFSSCLEEDEYKEVRDKALAKEIDINTLRTHMYALKGMKQEQLEKEQAENYSQKGSKNTEPVRIPVTSNNIDTEPTVKPVYGSLYVDLERIKNKRK